MVDIDPNATGLPGIDQLRIIVGAVMTVKGLVDQVVTLTYQELRAMPLFDQYVTIACVSNNVGGDLVGNALWTGVRLRDVLAMAGVHAVVRSSTSLPIIFTPSMVG